jgi:hypothetical protein
MASPCQHFIGLPSQRVKVVRGLPLFDRQITRGLASFLLSQKVKELFVPPLLPSGW